MYCVLEHLQIMIREGNDLKGADVQTLKAVRMDMHTDLACKRGFWELQNRSCINLGLPALTFGSAN